jgi:hypothetical protein
MLSSRDGDAAVVRNVPLRERFFGQGGFSQRIWRQHFLGSDVFR